MALRRARHHPLIDPPSSTNVNGTATLPVPLPNQPALLGAEAFTHWLVADAQGAAFGFLAASDALHVVVGR